MSLTRRGKHSQSPTPFWVWKPRHIALGIVEALVLWSTPQYKRFVTASRPPKIEKEWFETFIAEWRVARTLKEKHREEVREYLDNDLRASLASSPGGLAIDEAARHLQLNRWGSGSRSDGSGSLPLSVVAKVGFFLAPETIAPFDSLALEGLNRLRGPRKKGGVGHLKGSNYSDYMNAFNSALLSNQGVIDDHLKAEWVQTLGAVLGVAKSQVRYAAFRRKVFDNMLMSLAGRFD